MLNFIKNKKLMLIIGGGLSFIIIGLVTVILLMGNNAARENNQDANAKDTETTTEESLILQDDTEITEEESITEISYSSNYLVKVNRALNCVTVYAKDSNSEYTVPIKAMACSTGREGHSTPLGTFRTSGKSLWCLMVDGTYSQYAYRINGGIMFHSVPCFSKNYDALETLEYNKLGTHASLGCVRLSVIDAKWIYENCPSGTTVIIYDDYNSPGPLGKPGTIQIPEGHPLGSWDPTDPNPANPWITYTVAINCNDIINLDTGSTYEELLAGIHANDSLGNNLDQKILIEGSYDLNLQGTYSITLKLNWYPSVSRTITLNVNNVQEPTGEVESETVS